MDIFKEIKMTSFNTISSLMNKFEAIILNHSNDFNKKIAVKPVLNNLVFIAVKCRRDVTASARITEDQNGSLDRISTLTSELSIRLKAKANKKPFNLYKKTCCSHLYKA